MIGILNPAIVLAAKAIQGQIQSQERLPTVNES